MVALVSPKDMDGGSNPSRHLRLLSSVVEHRTFNPRVAGSIPAGGIRLWSGRNNGIQLLTPLGLMGDEGPSRESLCGPVCCLLALAVCGKAAGILGIR